MTYHERACQSVCNIAQVRLGLLVVRLSYSGQYQVCATTRKPKLAARKQAHESGVSMWAPFACRTRARIAWQQNG